MPSTISIESKIDTMQTNIEMTSCVPKTKATILIREAPIARRINSSYVRCSKEDRPMLICPNTETNSNKNEVIKSPN